MRVAYFDCPTGASGDMILAALLDAGLPEKALRENLGAVRLDTYDLEVKKITKSGLRATQVRVNVHPDSPVRHLSDILAIIRSSALDPQVQERAVKVFTRLAEVEAAIHGKGMSEVHLHELGGDDTIVDVTGVLLGLQLLGIEKMVASPLPLGRGYVEAAHGKIPLPAPATLELLKDAPVYGSSLEAELVTPTAGVLFAELVDSYGVIPAMTLRSVGYGAGNYDLPVPNLLRVLIGEAREQPGNANVQTLCLLETNLDDFNPQFYEPVIQHLFQAEALDVYLAPIQMKKNRPGTLLSVLCQPEKAEAIETMLFMETSTLGVRRQLVERRSLPRVMRQVQTRWGSVNVKVADLGEGRYKTAPEFEDCRVLAEKHAVPIQEIYLEVQLRCQEWSDKAGEHPLSPGFSEDTPD